MMADQEQEQYEAMTSDQLEGLEADLDEFMAKMKTAIAEGRLVAVTYMALSLTPDGDNCRLQGLARGPCDAIDELLKDAQQRSESAKLEDMLSKLLSGLQ